MKALVKTARGPGHVELQDVPEPGVGPGEVKIRVRAAGICGTDLSDHPSLAVPVILGHELAGDVVECGPRTHLRKVGERVTSETTAHVCGRCRFCRSEDYNLCVARRGISTRAPGAFASYLVIREESTHVLPDHVSYEAGALCEPLACAVHAVAEKGAVASGETVLILGPGPLGLLSVQVARACGAAVVAAGLSADGPRLALAKRLGADRTVAVDREDLGATARDVTGGYGFDVAVECSGAAAGVKAALAAVRTMGRFVQAGILHRKVTLDFDNVFFDREITLIGSHTQKPSSWRTALAWLADRRVDLDSLLSDVLPMERWEEGFRRVGDRSAIKIVLTPP
jgi:L-iditol 2-dehydrogenase